MVANVHVFTRAYDALEGEVRALHKHSIQRLHLSRGAEIRSRCTCTSPRE